MTFPLGRLLATPGAIEVLRVNNQAPSEFLTRHAFGDWGDVSKDDALSNNEAVERGSRILSAYHANDGTKLWIITEAADDEGDRAATTILLPDEY